MLVETAGVLSARGAHDVGGRWAQGYGKRSLNARALRRKPVISASTSIGLSVGACVLLPLQRQAQPSICEPLT